MAGLFTHVGDDSLLVIETPPVEEFSGDHANFYAHNPVGGEQEIIDAYSWALVAESFADAAEGYAIDALAALSLLDDEVAQATAQAAAAAASALAAAGSASAASTDADDASASAIAAGLSEDAAAASALSASGSASSATASASAASSSASSASGSASAASASAAAALISENNAEASELAAAASAAAAATFDPALYTTLGSTQTISGWKTFEAASGNSLLTIQKSGPTGQAVLDFRDDAGVQRNIFGLAGVAADDFFIGRYNDAGAWQGSIMYVPAATGIADFQYTPTVGGVALALSNAVVNLTTDQTIAGVKTFSSAPRCYRTAADMAEWWRTNATTNTGRWLFQIGANGEFFLLGLGDAGGAGQIAMQISRAGANVPAVNLYANNLVTLATQTYNSGDATTGAVVRHRNGGFYDVGLNASPIHDLTADLTLSPTYAGALIRKWDTVARTITIPDSTDTTIPIGARFEYAGWNPGVVTVTPGAGVTLSWLTGAGTSSGSRTLAQGSQVTLIRADAGRWMIWGIGIS